MHKHKYVILLNLNIPGNLNSNTPCPSPPKVIFLQIDFHVLGLGGSGFQKLPPFGNPKIHAQRAQPQRSPGPPR